MLTQQTTKPQIAQNGCVKKSLSGTRTRSTLSVAMLKDKVQRREIGQRIKALRERSGLTQEQIAKKLHVGWRQVQNYENPGCGDYSRVEQIAKLHWRLWAKDDPEYGYVSAGWIWDGKDRRETPDVVASLNGNGLKGQLDRIERKLSENQDGLIELLNHVDAALALLDVTADDLSSAPASETDARGSASKGRSRSARG